MHNIFIWKVEKLPLSKTYDLSKNVFFSFCDCFVCFIMWSAPFASAWVNNSFEKQILQKRRDNKLCFNVLSKKKQKKQKSKNRGFSIIFIYLAWMNFPVGHFTKIDNVNKMCNFHNSCKKLTLISHSPSQIYVKIPSQT